MTIINTSTHKVVLKTGSVATDLYPVAHFFIKDFFAAQLVCSGLLPVTITNTDPGVSRLVIWFDPNGTTTTDAENMEGAFKISNDGTSWITNPTSAQWRTWLQFYLASSSSAGSTLLGAFRAGVGNTYYHPDVVANTFSGQFSVRVLKSIYPTASRFFMGAGVADQGGAISGFGYLIVSNAVGGLHWDVVIRSIPGVFMENCSISYG